MAKLALEHDLNTNLVFRSRRQYRARHFGPVDGTPAVGVELLPMVNADWGRPLSRYSPAARATE
jgi:transposase-like protein